MPITGRTKKRLALLLTVVVLLGAAGGGLQVVRKVRLAASLNTALREGSAAYSAGDHATAIRHLNFYVRRKPDHDAALMLADARRQVPLEDNRHIPAAIRSARQALDLDPESVRAHEILLDLYFDAGYGTELFNTADSLLTLQPGHRRALEVRTVALARLRRFDEALTAALALARENPADIAMHRMVVELMHLNERPMVEVRAYLEEFAESATADFGFAVLQAEAALLTGDVEEGLVRARHAATLPITDATELSRFLRVLDALADARPETLGIAERVLSSEFPASFAGQVAIVAAERAWKAGRSDLARQHIQKAIDASESTQTAPAPALGWWVLLHEGSPSRDPDSTLRPLIDAKLDVLRSRASTAPDAALWIAIIEAIHALEAGDVRIAGERLEQARSLDAGNVVAEYLLGHVERQTGEWRRAAERWEPLLLQSPNWRALRNTYINLLLDHGQFDAAIEHSAIALRREKDHTEALQFCLAIMGFLESGKAEPARTTPLLNDIESIAKQAPADGAIQTCAARALLAAGRIRPASQAIARILDPDSTLPTAELLMPLALAYRPHDAKLASQLLELAQRSADAEGAAPGAIYSRAIALAEAGDSGLAEARSLFEQHIGSAAPRERLEWQYQLARFIGDPRGGNDPATSASLLASLAAEHSGNPGIQIRLLETDAAWQDESAVTAAIQRLRDIAGQDGTAWRIHEARRLLTFTPSQARAAQAIQVLAPQLRQATTSTSAGLSPSALALAGEAYLLLEDRDRAIAHLSRAVDAEPGRPNFYPRLIELLHAGGRGDEVIRRLTAFGRIDPISDEFRRLRAQLALSQGASGWDLALADYTVLTTTGSDRVVAAEDRFGLALVHIRRGNLARAGAILDDLVQLPQATPAMLIAAADLRGSSALRPNGASGANAAEREADIAAGRQLLESAPADIPPALRQALIAAYLQRHGQASDAEAMLVDAARNDHPDALAELARFYLDANRFDESQAALDRGLAADPSHSVLLRTRALLRIQRGEDTPQAWSELNSALNTWADAPPSLRVLTRAMQERAANPQDHAAHIGRMQDITRQHPTFYIGWQILVQSLVEARALSRASEAAQAAMRAIPADPRPAQLATTTLIEQERFTEALAAANQWRTRAANDTFDADLASAWLMQKLGRSQDGLRLLEPWRQRLVASPDLERLTLFAGLLVDTGRTADASRLLWPLAENDDRWAGAYLGLASRIGDPAAAREWLDRVQPRLVSDPGGQWLLGQAWFELVSKTRSPEDLGRVVLLLQELTSDPELGFGANMLLATVHERLELRTEAERFYRAAIALRPDDMVALNNLAYLLAPDPQTAPEAADLALRAVASARAQAAPPSVLRAVLDTQGLALLVLERWVQASEVFREALLHDPNAPDLLIGLAEARLGAGDPGEARSLLETARSRITAASPLSPTRASRLSALERRLAP